MTLAELLADAPKLHRVGSDVEISYQLSDRALALLDDRVGPGSRTLETGAGISTIVFAIKQSHHTCVVPDRDLVERIRTYCASKGVACDRIEFVVERSETALPRLEQTELDLVLIDGEHAFPSPYIDWYYTASRLRAGGLLVVDDTQLWTGRTLEEFLREEPEWRQLAALAGRTAVFEKVGDYRHDKWWGEQPYLVRRSRWSQRMADVRMGLDLVRGREFRKLATIVRSRLHARR